MNCSRSCSEPGELGRQLSCAAVLIALLHLLTSSNVCLGGKYGVNLHSIEFDVEKENKKELFRIYFHLNVTPAILIPGKRIQNYVPG